MEGTTLSDDLFDKLKKFRDSRIKLLISAQKIMIKELYKSFEMEYTETAICTLEEDSDSINITVSFDSFLSGESAGQTLTYN